MEELRKLNSMLEMLEMSDNYNEQLIKEIERKIDDLRQKLNHNK